MRVGFSTFCALIGQVARGADTGPADLVAASATSCQYGVPFKTCERFQMFLTR